jgi:hypothetical protein
MDSEWLIASQHFSGPVGGEPTEVVVELGTLELPPLSPNGDHHIMHCFASVVGVTPTSLEARGNSWLLCIADSIRQVCSPT